jgi:hypothetical protein
MAKIFISYSSKDKDFALRLGRDLEAAMHSVWLDEWEIKVGECIVSKISDGIKRADYAVIILTPASVASGWVDREWSALYWSEVQESRIKVLPILRRKCDIPPLLRSKKYADFTKKYETGYLQLLRAISSDPVIKHLSMVRKKRGQAVFRQLKPKLLKIRFEFLAVGQIIEAEVAANLLVAQLKRLLMEEMSFSDEFLDGRVASTILYSRTRDVMLNDKDSLENNGVQDGEILNFVFYALGA